MQSTFTTLFYQKEPAADAADLKTSYTGVGTEKQLILRTSVNAHFKSTSRNTIYVRINKTSKHQLLC